MGPDSIQLGIVGVLGFAVWIIVFGLLGGWVAGQCGREQTEGFLLGAFLGPFGVLIEALLPKRR